MKYVHNALRKLWSDESGSEVTEYAIVLGLIAVAAISLVAKFGTKVMARWGSINSSM